MVKGDKKKSNRPTSPKVSSPPIQKDENLNYLEADLPVFENSRQDSFDDLLKQVNQDGTKGPRPTSPKPKPPEKKKVAADKDHFVGDQENLGEDFETTPWVPPSEEIAKEFKKSAIYREGTARIDSVDIVSVSDLGNGVTLYFQFAMSMAICLFIMSILSLPSLIFTYNGFHIPEEDRDVFGMYKYTLGNIGYNPESSTYYQDSKCTSSAYAVNETCLHISGSEISLSDASNIITAFEFLQIIVFAIGAFHVYRVALSVTGRHTETSISDYTVMVTGLPENANDYDIVEHFSRLYRLDEPDWRGRPALQDSRPVAETSNSNNPLHLGTWVAECILHKRIGGFISTFKRKEHIMKKLYRCRAKMKMYAENSPHSLGHDLKHFLKAEKEMIATAELIDRLAQSNLKKTGIRIITGADDEDGKKTSISHISNPNSIYYNIDAPSIAAFVCFEYTESMARCITDYEKYNHFPWSMFYPNALKFNGHRINVVRAAEPDQIAWENLEIPRRTKLYLRFRTGLITICLVVACFIIILQASIYKEIFSNEIPSRSLCSTTIPLMYINGTSETIASQLNLARPPNSVRTSYDDICHSYYPGSFYSEYSYDGKYGRNASKYSFNACTETLATAHSLSYYGLCPHHDQEYFCPCVSTTRKESCQTMTCFDNDRTTTCQTYPAKNIGACYCYEALGNLLSSQGVANAMNIISNSQGNPCHNFYVQFSFSTSLTYASVIATTTVNVLLRMFLKELTKQEAHNTIDEEQASLISKIFLSNFITMAIIILVAYGTSSTTPDFFKTIHVFSGPYDDFTVSWYGTIGFYLMTTFILQSFSPLLYNLVEYFILKPFLRWFHHKRVAELKSKTIVMQYDLNMLEVGPIFNSTDHTAQLLTLLFFAMMYAPGLPLLMPLCCFAFILYFRVDKFLLCRYYQKPPNVGDSAIQNVVFYLPFAAVIRLGIAIWMFGNKNILYARSSKNTAAYESFLQTVRDHSSGFKFANDRLFLSNTFPLLVLLAAVVIFILVQIFWKQLPIYWFYRLFKSTIELCMKSKDIFSEQTSNGTITGWDLKRLNDPLRREFSAFTGEYFNYVKHKDEIPNTCYEMFTYAYLTNMSEIEIEEGWQMIDRGDFVLKIKLWKEDHIKINGKRGFRGDHKKTYEVIADHRCYSYDIEKVPAYTMAIKGLREGTTSLMESIETSEKDTNTGQKGHTHSVEVDGSVLSSSIVARYNKEGHNLRSSFFSHLEDADIEAQIKQLSDAVEGQTKTKPVSNAAAGTTMGKGNANANKVLANLDTEFDNSTPTNRPTSSSGTTHNRPNTSQNNRPGTTTNAKRPGTSNNTGNETRNFTFDNFSMDEHQPSGHKLGTDLSVGEIPSSPVISPRDENVHHGHKKNRKHH